MENKVEEESVVKPINVTESSIKNKLKIIAWLENLRWENQKIDENDIVYGYYCNDELFKPKNLDVEEIKKNTAEAILLTHYLVYICDRQMPYEDIFKAGGYTISTLVKNFIEQREDICREEENIRECIRKLMDSMIVSARAKNKDNFSYFLFCELDKRDKIANYFKYIKQKDFEKYGSENSEKIIKSADYAKFSSRFMVTDLLCIYRTLVYLCEKFKGSFTDFLKYAVGKSDDKKLPIVYDKKKKIYSLGYCMYRLTYQLVPQVKGNKEDIREILKQEAQGIIGLNTEVKKYLSEPNNSKKTEMSDDLWYINDKKAIANKYSFDKKKYASKRLWCVVRDFVYHPLFSKCFEIVTGEKTEDLKKNNAGEFELPGDVWNNNLKFAQCFWFGNKEYNNDVFKNIQKSSKFVRDLYENKKLSNWEEKNNEIQCYPKDFDITFNFVPNMCSKDKCQNCPLKPEGDFKLDKYCHKQKGKLCTFILYATGLEYVCKDSCELLEFQD